MESREDSFSFWKNTALILLFLVAAPLTIATATFSLFVISNPNPASANKVTNTPVLGSHSGVQVFASLPTKFPSISANAEVADARSELTREYLEYYNSVLTPYSQILVSASDAHGLDWRLLTAIAQQESNLCKWIPEGSHNCWGWGIHSEGTLGFASYEEGIRSVARGLKEEYIDKGYITPEEIMAKYTPLSQGSWARGVNKFMDEIIVEFE